MKGRISFFVPAALLALTLFSFKIPDSREEVFTCPIEFEIAATTSGGCTSFYVTGTDYPNFNWVGWEVTYLDGGSNLFKTFNAGSAFLTQTFGSGCDEPAAGVVRAKAMRVCDGVPYLSGWVYYGI